MRNIIKAAATASTLAASVFVAQPEAHAEWFTFSGLECVDARDTSGDIYFSDGAYNDSRKHTDMFHCPIVRPNSVTTTPIQVWVKVRDNNPFQDVKCRVKRCSLSGQSCVTSSYKSSSGEGFRNLYLGSVSIQKWGSAQIECKMPKKHGNWKRSGILKYSVLN